MIAALLATTAGRVAMGALAGAALITGVYLYADYQAYQRGVNDTRVAAAKEALERVQKMEKNNAAFKNLPALERCRAIMRDSGLPAGNCD